MLQTIISLLDSLRENRWDTLRLEPGDEQEKADLVWQIEGRIKAVQIKHSVNQITKAMVEGWAQDLERFVNAHEYELWIAGPVNKDIAQGLSVGRVRVAPPVAINMRSLLDQSAHLLNIFLESKAITKMPAFAQEIVVRALVERFVHYSTNGAAISRVDFENNLLTWIVSLYPTALNEAAEQLRYRCEEKLEEMRTTLKHVDRISEARFRLKYDACLEALAIVDEIFMLGFNVEVEQENAFEMAQRVRSCHNKLVLSCENKEVVFWFSVFTGLTQRTYMVADIIHLRSAVRKELGFGDPVVDTDPANAWFIVNRRSSFTMSEGQRRWIESLRKVFPVKSQHSLQDAVRELQRFGETKIASATRGLKFISEQMKMAKEKVQTS